MGCNLGKALPSRTSRRFVVPAIVGEGHAPPGAALPFGTGHHENVTHPRLVIARSEATWQSRSTRPDPRKTIGEIVTAFPRLPRPLRGLAMTSRGRLPFYRQPAPAVSAPPGPAVRSPAMAGAINVTAFPRLPRPLRGLAMTNRKRLPFLRWLVRTVSASPGAAVRSPTMAGAINVTAFPRLHPKGTSSRFALRAPRPLRGLAMRSRGRLPFYRHPVPAVSAPPGPAVRSPAMACAINVTAFPRSSRARSALAMRSRGLSPDFEFLTPR